MSRRTLRSRLGRTRAVIAAVMTVTALLLGGFVAAPAASAVTVAQHSTTAWRVLSLINQERWANRLPALTMSSNLTSSAYHHNVTMASHDTLSHQCSGEKSLGDRVDAAHYDWSTAGENIGWSSSTDMSSAYSLERAMYGERGPDDGHRQIILSRSFRNVGISVITDSTHHKLWLTEDFGHLM